MSEPAFAPYDPKRGLPASHPRKKPRRWGCLIAQLGCLSAGLTLAVALGVAVVIGLVVIGDLTEQLETGLSELEQYDATSMFQTTRVYDRHGNLLHEVFGEGRRTLIKLEEMPQNLIDATIATEDDSFWENPGVDLNSVIRAAFQWLTTGDIEAVAGTSTITQQVVRNIAFEPEYRVEKSVRRKMEEMILAMLLNERKTKSEILELYLNLNNYSNMAYGVEAAAQVYFGKPAKELNLAQATLIAGLPQAPGDLDPLSPSEEVRRTVKDRQRIVLSLMVSHGYLAQAEADAAYNEPLVLMNPDKPLQAPHFTVYAEQEVRDLLAALGEDPELFQSGGLQVYTTVDLRYHNMVQQVMRDHVAAMRDAHNMTNAAAVVIHPPTGEILAMIGSVDYDDDNINGQFNTAVDGQRQPGSALKPVMYATALEQGFSAAALLWDTPTQIGTGGQVYIPVNYDGVFHGPVRMRAALANSYNIPAVQMLRQVGVENLLAMAYRLGIRTLGEDASHYGLSLTLGGGAVTLLELTRAYTVFANEGYLVPTVAVACILDSHGDILYQYENRCPEGNSTPNTVNAGAQRITVLDPRVAFIVGDILGDNESRTPAMGANSPLNTGQLVTSAKTGTSNDFIDNWTVGYTHNLAVGVWTGNSDNSAMVNVSGLQGAAPIWRDVMLGIYGNPDLLAVLARDGQLLPDYRNAPPGMSRREVCRPASLQDPAETCPVTDIEWFLDSPAAVPQPDGSMAAPAPTPTAPPKTEPDPDDPMLTEIGYGVWAATVLPIPPDLQPALAPQTTSGATPMPPPRYCIAPHRWAEDPNAQPHLKLLWFIEAPGVQEDAARARLWAEERNIPVLPYLLCDDSLLNRFNAPQIPGFEAVWRITSPRPGEQVSGIVPVVGTAQFRREEVQFYKLEIGRQVDNPDNWRSVTFGSTHDQSVVDDVLEYLYADAIEPGNWMICLELVMWDGNFPTPYCVPIEIVRE
ncbi:MAG: transglycosylase domain-containing protein [Anaerolineae bacterium]|nr:transglycosylase domain-containing protein [Anaerolineae bacterium]